MDIQVIPTVAASVANRFKVKRVYIVTKEPFIKKTLHKNVMTAQNHLSISIT